MKKFRIIIDVLMYIIFIVLMGHHITENKIHEILGIVMFILFIIHNLLNFKFYKTIFKGKYNLKRLFLTTMDVLLLVCFIGIIISSINISSDIFEFLNIQTKSWGLKLHMLSTSWGFIMMSIHLGLHLNPLLNKINTKMKKSTFEYIYYLLFIVLIIYGIYSFIKQNYISDMFVLSSFKAYNYDESPFVFYLHTCSSSLCISLIIYLINIFKIKNRKEENKIGKEK